MVPTEWILIILILCGFMMGFLSTMPGSPKELTPVGLLLAFLGVLGTLVQIVGFCKDDSSTRGMQ